MAKQDPSHDDLSLLEWVDGCGVIPMADVHEEILGQLRERLLGQRDNPQTKPVFEESVPDLSGFQFLELIDQGGMGSVWKALQFQPIRRTVAIKLLRAGLDRHYHRIRQEGQALAVLDHPNIARIYDAGETAAGRPYFVMEYVQGQDICRYADSQQLTLSQRLSLFEVVCQSIQHCHARGVIHRDIKPSNVLVSQPEADSSQDLTEPQVKLIDFGLAKTNRDWQGPKIRAVTAERTVLGSPYWMSPEQAEGVILEKQIDLRTDIYSLGALLYQLVTGTPPLDPQVYDSKSDIEIIDAVQRVESEKPSHRLRRLVSQVKGEPQEDPRCGFTINRDLDRVILMALEKDPGHRYQTAAEFRDDISRILNQLPVKASFPALGYRASKWITRNRIPVVVSLVISAVVAALLTQTVWQNEAKELAERRSKQAAVTANRKIKEADKATQTARTVSEKNRALAEDLKWLDQEYMANLDRMYPYSKSYAPWRKDPVHLEEVSSSLFSRDLSEERRLRLGIKIARIWRAYDQPERAHKVLNDCLSNSDVEEGVSIFKARCLLAANEISFGNVESGLAALSQLISSYENSNAPSTVEIAEKKSALASYYYHAGQTKAALELAEAVLAYMDEEQIDVPRGKFQALGVLAMVYDRLGSFEKAVAACQQAQQVEVADLADHIKRLYCGGNLLDIYKNSGQTEKSYQLVLELLDISNEWLGPQHAKTLDLRKSKCLNRFLSGDHSGVTAELEEIYEDCVAFLGEEHRLCLNVSSDLALVYNQNQEFTKAVAIHERTIDKRSEVFGGTHPATIKAINIYSFSLIALGKNAQALSELAAVLRRSIDQDDLTHLIVLDTLQKYVLVCLNTGEVAKAIPLLESCLGKVGGRTPDESQFVANIFTREVYAGLAVCMGDFIRSERVLREIIETPGFPASPNKLTVYLALAEILVATEQYDAAGGFVDFIFEEKKRNPIPRRVFIAARILHAEIQLNQGALFEARFILDRIQETLNKQTQEDILFSYYTAILYADIFLQSGQMDSARVWFLSGYRGLSQISQLQGTYDWRRAKVSRKLVHLFRATGDSTEADAWEATSLEWKTLRLQMLAAGYFHR